MRIAVIGTGAMGCLFAGKLAPLTDLLMIGSWAAQLAAINQQGLTIEHLDGSRSRQRLRAVSDASSEAPFDVALLLVKSHQTAKAARQAERLLKPEGIALTLQNGIGNYEELIEAVGSERAALGVTAHGATIRQPGLVRHAGRGSTALARTAGTAVRLEGVAAVFNQAGVETSLVDDPSSLIWGKLVVNCGINPLTALLDVPNGFLAEDAAARAIMETAAAEAAAVAQGLQITLPFADPAARALAVATATAANISSMLQDIRRGAATEIEAISGAVAEIGAEMGIPVPVNHALAELIRTIERGHSLAALPPDSPIAAVSALIPSRLFGA